MNTQRARGKAVIITRPDGTEVEYASQSMAARGEKGLAQSPISELCRGVKSDYLGFKARFKTDASVSPTPAV